MPAQDVQLGDFGFAGDDSVVPFQVDALDTRGRAVQLGPMLDTILARHDYPDAVAALLAEAIVVAVLVGTSLKFDGRFTLQSQTDGPVNLVVVDFKTPDSVRAYARFEEGYDWSSLNGTAARSDLLGTGMLGLTIDQGPHMQRYQGVVELRGATFEEAARTYFRQSEQIPTDLRIAVSRIISAGEADAEGWRAGGLLVQFLPESAERMRMPDLPGGDGAGDHDHAVDDAWNEITALVSTIQADELTDPQVGVERLIYRLFHEHNIRVFDANAVIDKCSCSAEKIRDVLTSFPDEELTESISENGRIQVDCEFCSKHYEFEPEEIRAVRASGTS